MDVDPSAHEYDMLLPNEARSIKEGDPRDIDHWIRVYTELCSFKEKLLETLVEQRQNVELAGRLEVDHDDMIFRREHARLQRRLQYLRGEKDKLRD